MITGANGNLGRRLVKRLLSKASVVAVVRSDKAANSILDMPLSTSEKARLSVQVVDYTSVVQLSMAAAKCHRAVHLVGILKEGGGASYYESHEQSSQALADALNGTGVVHVTYLSIVGSKADADNACLASKGRAEEILRNGQTPCCILRVPMVLGSGDYASFALAKRARQRVSVTFRAESLEQPIYAGDVIEAIYRAGSEEVDQVLDLAGPETLSRRALTQRAATLLGTSTSVVSLPIALGFALAGILEMLTNHPPFTRAMLGVLDHDDAVYSDAAWQTLKLAERTTLDDMLEKVLQP